MAQPRDPDKARADILEAALSEFAERGFADASTNHIAQRAGVAKGLVFHHFGSKAGLFEAVLDKVYDDIERAFDETMRSAPWDPLSRAVHWTRAKAWMMRDDARPFWVILESTTRAPPEVAAAAHRRGRERMRGLHQRLMREADLSRLRPGVDAETFGEAVWAVAAGLESTLLPLLGRSSRRVARTLVEQALRRADGVFRMLRFGAYPAEDKRDEMD